MVQRSAYKPFGERITLEQKAGERSITNRGYTGHEEIEGTRLVHMNARLYDPTLGRFLSADTLIQDPYDTQSYNRYTYVRNNPLKYTDPSGHSFASVIKAIVVAIVVIVVSYVALIALGVTAGGSTGYLALMAAASLSDAVAVGAIAGFAGGFLNSFLSGASPGEALVAGLQGALIGGLGAGVAHAIGTEFAGKAFHRAIAHGVTRGIIGRVQGGNFSNGFMSGLASSALGNITQRLTDITNYAKLALHTLVGGTVSAIGGGKFANGAVSGAVVYLFNDMNEGHGTYPREDEMVGKKYSLDDYIELQRAEKALLIMVRSKEVPGIKWGADFTYSQAYDKVLTIEVMNDNISTGLLYGTGFVLGGGVYMALGRTGFVMTNAYETTLFTRGMTSPIPVLTTPYTAIELNGFIAGQIIRRLFL